MHGNVNEWVQDVWLDTGYPYSKSATAIDPRGPDSQGWRVTRGGDFYYDETDCRAAGRYSSPPEVTPAYTTGFRIAVPTTVRRSVPEPIPNEVKILLGATEEQLLKWAEEIGQEYLPVAMNPRHNTRPSLVDAIAIPNEAKSPWQIHSAIDADADFQAMWGSHRPAWRMPISVDEETEFKTVFVWVVDIPYWQTWAGAPDFIVGEAARPGVEGFSPGSLFGMKTSQWEGWTLTKVPLAGAEVRHLPVVNESELNKQIDEFRARGWRPIRLMQHVGFDSPQFSVVFRDNPHRIKWQYDADLSETDFQTRRDQFQKDGLLPTLIASAVKDNEVRYRVVWSESRGD
jgi:hypothetical protein